MGRLKFGFGKRNRGEGTVKSEMRDEPVASQWDEMAEEMQAERELEAEAQRESERQQRKIMKYFLEGENEQILEEHDVGLNEEDEAEFGQLMRQGKITAQDEEIMLKIIKGPVDQEGADWVYDRVMSDPWQAQLYGMVTEYPKDDSRQIWAANLKRFMKTEEDGEMSMQTPMGFQSVREAVLDGLSVYPQYYDRYEAAMDKLEHNLYGKRFEYYRVFEALRRKWENEDKGPLEQNFA